MIFETFTLQLRIEYILAVYILRKLTSHKEQTFELQSKIDVKYDCVNIGRKRYKPMTQT